MLTEVQYRTFDELLDSVRIDLRTYDLEGMIDNQSLIKVAMRVNYELGLKVNPSRSKVIKVVNGKAKLPADFHVLNFALLCKEKKQETIPSVFLHDYRTYCQGVIDGKQYAEDLMRTTMKKIYSTVMDIATGNNIIEHNLNTKDYIVQAFDTDGNMLDFKVNIPNSNQLVIISEVAVTLTDVKIVLMTGDDLANYINNAQILDPCADQIITPSCSNQCSVTLENSSCGTTVSCSTPNSRYKYNVVIPIKMEKNKSVSPDCFTITSRYHYQAKLKNGFLITNIEEGDVYINYQSLMEDDEGNLLVMDHPMVNEYYEYAIKQRVFEDMYLNGESVQHTLQVIEGRAKNARVNALSFVNTPDFGELRQMWETNRKAQHYNYYTMFENFRNDNRYSYGSR